MARGQRWQWLILWLGACQQLIAGRCCLCNGRGSQQGKPGATGALQIWGKTAQMSQPVVQDDIEHGAGLLCCELRCEPWFLLLSGLKTWTLSATGSTLMSGTSILCDRVLAEALSPLRVVSLDPNLMCHEARGLIGNLNSSHYPSSF